MIIQNPEPRNQKERIFKARNDRNPEMKARNPYLKPESKTQKENQPLGGKKMMVLNQI